MLNNYGFRVGAIRFSKTKTPGIDLCKFILCAVTARRFNLSTRVKRPPPVRTFANRCGRGHGVTVQTIWTPRPGLLRGHANISRRRAFRSAAGRTRAEKISLFFFFHLRFVQNHRVFSVTENSTLLSNICFFFFRLLNYFDFHTGPGLL